MRSCALSPVVCESASQCASFDDFCDDDDPDVDDDGDDDDGDAASSLESSAVAIGRCRDWPLPLAEPTPSPLSGRRRRRTRGARRARRSVGLLFALVNVTPFATAAARTRTVAEAGAAIVGVAPNPRERGIGEECDLFPPDEAGESVGLMLAALHSNTFVIIISVLIFPLSPPFVRSQIIRSSNRRDGQRANVHARRKTSRSFSKGEDLRVVFVAVRLTLGSRKRE